MVSSLVAQREGRFNQIRRPKSVIRVMPAPTGGWNTRDALTGMPPEDATVLDNWFPDVGKVSLRGGHEDYATGLVGNVDTLVELQAGTVSKFLAAANGNWWDISSSGAGSSLASGYLSDRWQTVQFNGTIHAVNGSDSPIAYDGTTISTPAWSGSGLTNSTLNTVMAFKNRLFFGQKNSQDFWYADLNAVSGTLTKFPLSRVAGLGGNLIAIGTWTLDAGDGVDDLAVFFMESGQVVVYAGTDPGDSSAWALQGIYNIGSPVDPRGVVKFAGDLLVVDNDDYHTLSSVLQLGRARVKESKISGAARDAVKAYRNNTGWQAIHYSNGSMLFVNVPVSATEFEQHVRNTTTGAWCRFTGWNGRCWGIYNDNLYFGGVGVVQKADTGTDDDGANITATAQTAWTDFGRPSNKKINMIRPVMAADGTLNIGRSVGVDFRDFPLTTTSSSASSGSEWDLVDWDTAEWSPEATTRTNWIGVKGQGEHIALKIEIATQGQAVDWFKTDVLYEPGFGL